ncbi:hypothetical protein [Paraburkholderia solisilvae]|uniref:hypothetical protein n=1 Tax=Paraburkholderia solisilvae TaxID=624376 RepID=UPI001582BCB5|nr:hypothetical protein [Paraburkholderia solisilvae]
MNRRTFVAAGAWYSGGMRMPAWLAGVCVAADRAAPSGPARSRETLAIFDAALAQAGAFADEALRLRMPIFDSGDDIGTLWHMTLAPRLAHAPAVLIGFTRASDFFVLTRLASRPGRLVAAATDASRPHADAPVSFVMSV